MDNKPWETDYIPQGQPTPHWTPRTTPLTLLQRLKRWWHGVLKRAFPPKPLTPYLEHLLPLVFPEKAEQLKGKAFLDAMVRYPKRVARQIEKVQRSKPSTPYSITRILIEHRLFKKTFMVVYFEGSKMKYIKMYDVSIQKPDGTPPLSRYVEIKDNKVVKCETYDTNQYANGPGNREYIPEDK